MYRVVNRVAAEAMVMGGATGPSRDKGMMAIVKILR